MVSSKELRVLSAYEIERLERIKKNEAYLASLGLSKAKEQMTLDMTKKVNQARTRPARLVTPPLERRMSKRIKKRQGDSPGSSRGSDDDELLMLSYSEVDERNMRAVKQSNSNQTVKLTDDDDGSTSRAPRAQRKINFELSDDMVLTKEEKEVLAKSNMDDNYLEKFREFLVYHDKISPQNERNVMRQVTKLSKGEGIRYESPRYGWPEGCYFMKGSKVTPLSDIVDLLQQAVEAENKWGHDHGNGWLLRHPLKKLLLFQQFCLNNPDFLTAECKLKDYYAGP